MLNVILALKRGVAENTKSNNDRCGFSEDVIDSSQPHLQNISRYQITFLNDTKCISKSDSVISYSHRYSGNIPVLLSDAHILLK